VNLVLSHVTHRPVSLFVYITNTVVVGVQALVTAPENILLGIIVIVLETLVWTRPCCWASPSFRSLPLRNGMRSCGTCCWTEWWWA
jgi:hypothetical protein